MNEQQLPLFEISSQALPLVAWPYLDLTQQTDKQQHGGCYVRAR